MLGETGVPVTEFRAAVIVGRDSVSFRMMAYLSERLPVMITPKWVSTRIQPIAEEDVLAYLVAALDTPASAGRVVEIGGADVLTYGDMIRVYAAERGLHRYLHQGTGVDPAAVVVVGRPGHAHPVGRSPAR